MAPDPVGIARQQAKKQNKRVEIESYRAENSTTFANPDGKTLYTELHSTPIRVQKNGVWQAIDTTLVEEGGVIKPKAVKGELTLSAGGNTALVKAQSDKGKAAISATGKLHKPQLSGNTATYPSAYGHGVDLVVTATPTGFYQEIVIRQRPTAAMKARIKVDLPAGMSYDKDSSGRLTLLADKGNKKIADLAAVPMTDAAASKNIEAGRTGTAAIAVEHNATGQTLVITPDAGFLADPAVVYPVTVAAASDTWTGTGIDGDTFVNNAAYPTGSTNNALNRIIVGKSNSGTVTWRGYIRFNIKGTPLEGGTIDPAAGGNADLRLWNYDTNNCSDTNTAGIVARRITSDWSMSDLRWNNQPSITFNGQDANRGAYGVNCPEGEGELYHTIEPMVQAWMNGAPDYGVQLSSASEDVPTNWRWYRSFEYGGYDGWPGEPRGPVLFISYTPPPVTEEIHFLRDYPGDQPIPSTSYAEEKAWAESSVYDGETAPGRTVTPEAAQEAAAARGSSVDLNAMDASYPSGLTDEELVEGFDPEPDGDTGTPPTPNPVPTPPAPDTVLNANPYFETDIAPWTVTGGILDRSTDRAHESSGTASAKVTVAEGSEVSVRSEPGIPIRWNYQHATSGWFYPVGGNVTVQWGVDWFNAAGSLVGSSMTEHTLTGDTWAPINATEAPPANAVTAQLRLSATADPGTPVTLYADELKLLSHGGTTPEPGEEHTVTLPLEDDAWIDSTESFDDTSGTLWSGTYDSNYKIAERTYLRFDTTAIAGKQVTAAVLQLWNVDSYGCGDSDSGIIAKQITAPWSTGTLTWAGKPASTSVNEATARDPEPCQDDPPVDAAWRWPVTGIAQAWTSAQANHGLVLQSADESATAPLFDRGFNSSRSGADEERLPRLTVTYIDSPGSSPTPTPTPPGGSDTTPPEVVEVSPANDTGNVPADANVTARFSEPVTNAQLSLIDIFTEEEVSGTSSMSADGRLLTFTPSTLLDSYYWAEVSGARDAASNTMIDTHTWWFTNYEWSSATEAARKAAPTALVADKLRIRGADTDKGQASVSTDEPSLLINVPDSLGPYASVAVEIAHTPSSPTQGRGVIWTGKADTREGASRAAAEIQVPAGKLKSGWQVRWRARVSVAGVGGDWSEWQPFTVEATTDRRRTTENSTVSAADTTADEIKRFLPTDKDIAKPVTFSECQAAPTTKSWVGYTKNRFAYCNEGPWVSRFRNKIGNVEGPPIGEVLGRRLMRVTTSQTGREFEVTTHIWITSSSGVLANTPHKFYTKVDDPSGNDACDRVSTTGITLYATPDQWRAATQEWQITERFRTDVAEGPDKIGSCTITPMLARNYKGLHSAPGHRSFTVRCDTSSLISWHNRDSNKNLVGGCVSMDAIPAQSLARNDVNEKNVKVDQVYDHIKRALTPGSHTNPARGGVAFPDLTQAKAIPGGTPRNPLTRSRYSPDRNASQALSHAVCVLEFGESVTRQKDLECDEFPFAATEQGSAFAKPRHNFSVQMLSKAQNQGYGKVLTAWYSNNRILRTDKFYMRLK